MSNCQGVHVGICVHGVSQDTCKKGVNGTVDGVIMTSSAPQHAGAVCASQNLPGGMPSLQSWKARTVAALWVTTEGKIVRRRKRRRRARRRPRSRGQRQRRSGWRKWRSCGRRRRRRSRRAPLALPSHMHATSRGLRWCMQCLAHGYWRMPPYYSLSPRLHAKWEVQQLDAHVL